MSKLRTYLQLMRFPAVFTAMADICLGFSLNHAWDESLSKWPWLDFGLLLLASSCLYLAGMVLNDLFDRKVDAVERPQRPIPSGRVPARNAAVLGGMLMLAGLGAAGTVGLVAIAVAGALAVMILAYDVVLKKTPLGPVAMGGCRSLNILLGAAAVPSSYAFRATCAYHWPVAVAMGVYVAGLTWFARHETGTARQSRLLGPLVVINAGLAGLIGYVLTRTGAVGESSVALALAVVVLVLNRRVVSTILKPSPETMQATVKTLIMTLVVLDATLVFYKTGSSVAAMATIALLVPAMFLGRWIYVT